MSQNLSTLGYIYFFLPLFIYFFLLSGKIRRQSMLFWGSFACLNNLMCIKTVSQSKWGLKHCYVSETQSNKSDISWNAMDVSIEMSLTAGGMLWFSSLSSDSNRKSWYLYLTNDGSYYPWTKKANGISGSSSIANVFPEVAVIKGCKGCKWVKAFIFTLLSPIRTRKKKMVVRILGWPDSCWNFLFVVRRIWDRSSLV